MSTIPLAGGWLGDADYDSWKLQSPYEDSEDEGEDEDTALDFESQWLHATGNKA